MGEKVVGRWKVTEKRAAWGLWNEFVSTQHTVRHCIAGLLQNQLMRAMHAWCDRAQELKEEKELMCRVARSLFEWRLGHGFRKWLDDTRVNGNIMDELEKVVGRWKVMEKRAAWGLWNEFVSTQHTVRHCIAGLLQNQLMRAMHAWCDRAQELKE